MSNFRKFHVCLVVDYVDNWTCVSIVNDYSDTVLAELLTTPTQCWHSQQLHGQGVGIVVDYVETVLA